MSLLAEIQKKTKKSQEYQKAEQDKFVVAKMDEFLPRIEQEINNAAKDGKSKVTIVFNPESLRYPGTQSEHMLYDIIKKLMKKDAPLEGFSGSIEYTYNSLQLYLTWFDNQTPTLSIASSSSYDD